MPDKQRVILICENRNIDRAQINKLGYFLRCKKTPDAWYCLREFLQQVRGWKGPYWLPVDERYAMPVSPYQDQYYDDTKLAELADMDKVADQAADFTATESELQGRKTRYYDFMGIAALGAVSAFIIIILLFVSGKIDLGAIMRQFSGGIQ